MQTPAEHLSPATLGGSSGGLVDSGGRGGSSQASVAAGMRRLHERLLPTLLGLFGILAAIGILEALCAGGVISPLDMPAPHKVAVTFASVVRQGSFWSAVGDTMKGWLLGLACALAVALPAGMLMGRIEIIWRAMRPTVEFLRPIPTVAFIPVVILLWGNGVKGNVILTAFATLWPLLIQTIDGARDVDPVALDTMRAFGIPLRRRITALILPSALPHVVTGFRIATAVALVVAITSELVIGTPGLGNSIVTAENAGNLRVMYAEVLAAGLLGVGLHLVTAGFQRRVLHWHPSERLRVAS